MKTFRNPMLSSLFAVVNLSTAYAAPKGGGGAAAAKESAVALKEEKPAGETAGS
jgi:hypothetical protein